MAGAERRRRAGLASALLGLPRSDRDERALRAAALDALDALGVADVAGRAPATLPFPVQKRVALARALVGDPASSCSTSPRAVSAATTCTSSASGFAACGATWRCCSSSTTWTSSCRPATAWSCWTSAGASRRARPPRSLRSARARCLPRGRGRCCRLRDSRPPTAPSARWTASPSRWRRGASRRSWGPTARARRRCCARSRGSSAPGRAHPPRRAQHRPAARRGDRPPRAWRTYPRDAASSPSSASRTTCGWAACGAAAGAATAWPASTSCSRSSPTAARSWPAPSPAASARCSSSAAR